MSGRDEGGGEARREVSGAGSESSLECLGRELNYKSSGVFLKLLKRGELGVGQEPLERDPGLSPRST